MPLHFLEPGRSYTAQICRDGDDAEWDESPSDLVYEERTVDSSMTLTLHLAPGGGQAIRFTPVDER